MKRKRKELIIIYRGCDIVVYNDNGIRRYCWGNLCWKDINEAKKQIDKLNVPNDLWR